MLIGELISLITCNSTIAEPKPEERLSEEVANMMRQASLTDRAKCLWFFVWNEGGGGKGKTSAMAYSKAKAMGLIPGVADFWFIRGDKVVAIELKSKVGRQNDKQKLFEKWCVEHQVVYEICRTAKEVEAVLIENGLLEA